VKFVVGDGPIGLQPALYVGCRDQSQIPDVFAFAAATVKDLPGCHSQAGGANFTFCGRARRL